MAALGFYTVESVSSGACPKLSSLISMEGHPVGNENEVLLASCSRSKVTELRYAVVTQEMR